MSDDRQQSEFNMAVSYLNRLNALFYVCDEAAMNLNAFQWFHALLALYRELSTEMKDKEKADMRERQKRINPMVQAANTDATSKGVFMIKPELYDELHDFEMIIRGVLKDAGLQSRMLEDASKALK